MKTIDNAPYRIEAVWYLPELKRQVFTGAGLYAMRRDFEFLTHPPIGTTPAAIYIDISYREE